MERGLLSLEAMPRQTALRLRATLSEASALSELGRMAESRAAFERARAFAADRGDLASEGQARCGLARLDAHAGAWRRALEGFAQAKVCAIRSHDRALLHVAAASAAFHGSELGDSEEQLAPIERAAAYLRSAGDERESLFWAVQLGRGYTDFDRLDRARALLDDALSRACALGDRSMEGLALFALGGVLLSGGDLDEAAARYRRATEALAEVGRERERGYALGQLGVVEQSRERFDDAGAAYAEAISVLSDVGDAPNALLFSLFLAGLDADRGRVGDAVARLRDARASVEAWAGSGVRPLVAELVGAMIEAARARAARDGDDLRAFLAHRRVAEQRLRQADRRPERIRGAREKYDWRDVSLEVRVAARLARRAVEDLTLPRECMVVVGECSAFRPGHGRKWADLSRRPVLRRVLAKLADARRKSPGASVPASELVAAGWPGERMTPASAANRLHVTLGMLRGMGMRELLQHVPGGWRLRPEVPLLQLDDDEGDRP
jgi:tetratricopeptide (TPR) repeat protein